MPFLRFTRDKRGYETTSLVHSFRGRHGRSRQKVLYWFRTPPNVKVGRPALDEDAIRWIEEHNPDIDFDWPKILAATPPPAQTEDARGRLSQQRVKGRRGRQAPADAQPAPISEREEQAPPVEVDAATTLEGESAEPESELPEEQALEQLTHPDAEELPPIAETPLKVEGAVGHEQLTRLRARFAELQARITERGGDAARIESLRAQAEPLNPDSWVTAEDVQKGMEGFEARIRDLRAALGLKRRRRSRRGGRRRRRSPTAAAPQTTGPDMTSNHESRPNGDGRDE